MNRLAKTSHRAGFWPNFATHVVLVGLSILLATPILAMNCTATNEAYCGGSDQATCKLDKGDTSFRFDPAKKSGVFCREFRCFDATIASSVVVMSAVKYQWFAINGKDFAPIYGFLDLANHTFFAQSKIGFVVGKCD